MHRSIASRVVLFASALLILVALQGWGWRPFAAPEPVENGEDETELGPQRIALPPTDVATSSGKTAVFAGSPYLVGNIVTPTKTLPEAETNITVNPANSANLVAIITDYSQR